MDLLIFLALSLITSVSLESMQSLKFCSRVPEREERNHKTPFFNSKLSSCSASTTTLPTQQHELHFFHLGFFFPPDLLWHLSAEKKVFQGCMCHSEIWSSGCLQGPFKNISIVLGKAAFGHTLIHNKRDSK